MNHALIVFLHHYFRKWKKTIKDIIDEVSNDQLAMADQILCKYYDTQIKL